jgi:hypothetical protein
LQLGVGDGHVLDTLDGILYAIDGSLDSFHCAITGGGVKSCKSAGGGDVVIEEGRTVGGPVRIGEIAGRSRGEWEPLVTTAARQHIQQKRVTASYDTATRGLSSASLRQERPARAVSSVPSKILALA